MTSVTDLYFINYKLAMCEVWLAFCFVMVALGFTEILMAVIFLSGDDLLVGALAVGFGLYKLAMKDLERYYWIGVNDRII